VCKGLLKKGPHIGDWYGRLSDKSDAADEGARERETATKARAALLWGRRRRFASSRGVKKQAAKISVGALSGEKVNEFYQMQVMGVLVLIFR